MRLLTGAQHDRLDKLADTYGDEGPKVVGWAGTARAGGPVLQYGDTYRYVNRQGRLCGSRGPQRELAGVNYG